MQEELSGKISELSGVQSGSIPFLTSSEGLGERNIVEEKESKLRYVEQSYSRLLTVITTHVFSPFPLTYASGPIIIEDSVEGDSLYRRMVFLNTPYLIQCEAKFNYGKNKTGFLTHSHFSSILNLDLDLDLSYMEDRNEVIYATLMFVYPLFLQPSNSAEELAPVRVRSSATNMKLAYGHVHIC